MRTGVWLVGARGSVATTGIVGGLALRAGLTAPTGCVTELPDLRGPALPTFADLVFGGHDVATTPLTKRAEALAAAGVLPGRLATALAADLAAVEDDLRPAPTGGSQADRAAAITADLTAFRDRHQPRPGGGGQRLRHRTGRRSPHPGHADLGRAARPRWPAPTTVLPPSSLYAYAAFAAGCPFVDFTPSTGPRLPALAAARRPARPAVRRARRQDRRDAGQVGARPDVRDAQPARCAPGPGSTCSAAATARPWPSRPPTPPSRPASSGCSRETLGYVPAGRAPASTTSTDIGDFKTAWDLVTFAGFLGTRMRMEFTWHGCDSALAAPLVLDLARLTAGRARAPAASGR